MRGGSSRLLNDVQRAKVLAWTVKAQRAPQWPTAPTTELPPRSICDMLVENYLRTIEKLYQIVHITTFLKEYEAIWANDTQPDTGFIIQLKLILAIGATLYDSTFSMRTEATRWVYEAQTWLMSPAFKSKLGICFLQNSILVLLARELVNVGGELIWISARAVVRSAVYMGLHKDPAQLQHNVFHHLTAHTTIPSTPPKLAQLGVQLFHNHAVNLSEVLKQDRLDSSTLSPVVALYMAFATRW
ncbi:hypothetical protein EJ07DRAFT_105767 [Lizonia empirigonia]|nr:hypothetical protein EJ07DRAFT_105767 [Lizonia empirigonia]